MVGRVHIRIFVGEGEERGGGLERASRLTWDVWIDIEVGMLKPVGRSKA